MRCTAPPALYPEVSTCSGGDATSPILAHYRRVALNDPRYIWWSWLPEILLYKLEAGIL